MFFVETGENRSGNGRFTGTVGGQLKLMILKIILLFLRLRFNCLQNINDDTIPSVAVAITWAHEKGTEYCANKQTGIDRVDSGTVFRIPLALSLYLRRQNCERVRVSLCACRVFVFID